MNKQIILSLLITVALIGGAVFFTRDNSRESDLGETASVEMVDGKQIINISAKGGYSPRIVNAKAGIDTVIKMKTENTFDCSASLVIPEISYQKLLSSTGVEEIEISGEKAKGTMQGLCSMGMYNFQIRFN